jgi:DNA-directed RNA polymerase subunit RPC12/RpoP
MSGEKEENQMKTKYVYLCPNCGYTFESDKKYTEIKTCKKCGHKFVSHVCFEE